MAGPCLCCRGRASELTAGLEGAGCAARLVLLYVMETEVRVVLCIHISAP